MEQKEWWQSRTIWSGILTAVSGILAASDLIPAEIDDTVIDELVTLGLGIATVYFRAKADKEIAPLTP
jgi:predicted amino acid-binding ACT domain protein